MVVRERWFDSRESDIVLRESAAAGTGHMRNDLPRLVCLEPDQIAGPVVVLAGQNTTELLSASGVSSPHLQEMFRDLGLGEAKRGGLSAQ